MSTPAKPWRVYGNHLSHLHLSRLAETYRSQTAAYDAVKELTGFGHTATVEHWEDGGWRLYERVEPQRDPEPETEREAGQ